MEKELTVREMASRGGLKTVKRYGKEWMAKIGRRGGKRTLKKHGKKHFSRIRKKAKET